MSKNELSRIAASEGSELYSGAGTYKTSNGTLQHNTMSIYIREDQAAMITSAKCLVNGSEVALSGGKIASALKAGDYFTFKYPLSEIVISGGSFIGHQS